MLSCISAMLRYFPVPVISRELNVLPAIIRGEWLALSVAEVWMVDGGW
jgi:hypothetical protein